MLALDFAAQGWAGAGIALFSFGAVFLHSRLQSLRHQLRHVPVEVLELSPPHVQTALTGDGQLSDPRAMPLAAYVDETLRKLWAGEHPRGELLLDRDLPRRFAERDGRYGEAFPRLNPA